MSEWRGNAAGIDGALGGGARTAVAASDKTDDFALATWRGNAEGPAQLVNVYRATGMTLGQQAAKIHEMHAVFHYDLMLLDFGGGGQGIRDDLREPWQDDGRKKWQVRPIITVDDEQLAGVGDARLAFFSRAESRIKGNPKIGCPGVGLLLTAESMLINKAHELLRAALQRQPQDVQFPPPWGGIRGMDFSSADQMRTYSNGIAGLGDRDKAAMETELALAQLIQIGRDIEKDGITPKTDRFGFYSFASDQKKDAAYAIVMGYFAIWMLRETAKNTRTPEAKHDSPIYDTEIM